jgi:hypothetical protein
LWAFHLEKRSCPIKSYASTALVSNTEHPNVEVKQLAFGVMRNTTPLLVYPVVVAIVDGIKCRALLDTGAGSPLE